MNKEWLDKQIGEIDVPKDEIYSAITKGISAGKKAKYKKKKRIRLGVFVTSAAASIVLASGFLFAPITNVLANVPILGSIYENFTSPVGYELFSNNLVTSLNENSTSNNVDITITSAYYDGNVIGITFKAQGKNLSIEHIDEGKRPASGYSYHLFDGLENKQWSSGATQLEETEDGFVGAVEFFNPSAQIPANFTLPIVFTSMADVKGTWKFDIPVEQIPFEKIPVASKSASTDGEYAFKMNSIIKGKATTMFEYNTSVPAIGKDDVFEIAIFDNNKNWLSKSHANVLNSNTENGIVEKSVRELFTSKIKEDASYLMVYPEVRRYEEDTIHSLSNSTPFQIKSNRFDYEINVTSIETKNDKMTVDYMIQNVSTDFRKDIVQNFADFIKIIKTDDIKADEHGELLHDQMLEFSMRSDQAKLINADELHFQSTFIIENLEGLNTNDYSLMVPFGTLSSNDPIKLEPIKIDLTNN